MRLALASSLAALLLPACGDDGGTPAPPDGPTVYQPMANPARGIETTGLAIDLAQRSGVATIGLAASATGPGADLEVGDLEIRSVTAAGAPVPFTVADGTLLLGLAPERTDVAIEYGWRFHEASDGVDMQGFTLTWPYHCGNVFPCHSQPADGTTFTMDVTGNAAGTTVVYPRTIAAEAPAYMAAWVVGDYTKVELGTTAAGTRIAVWHLPNEGAAAAAGAAHLRDAFDWLEQNLGPYRFGDEAGSVSVAWGRNAYGGMEHHPYWHIANQAIGDESIHLHEAAHGWFGDGIRLRCWEDFVMSEGAATYYEARLVEEVVGATEGAAAWQALENELAQMRTSGGVGIARPESCGAVDVLDIFTRVPYVKGAMFLRALERRLTRPTFDRVMRTLYERHATQAATLADLAAIVREIGGYEPGPCITDWLLRQPVPTALTCP